MRRASKIIFLAFMAILLVSCGPSAKEPVLETNKETISETKPESTKETETKETDLEGKKETPKEESKKEILKETTEETKPSEENKGSKKEEIDGADIPNPTSSKEKQSTDKVTKKKEAKKEVTKETDVEVKKEKPVKKKSNKEVAKEVLNGLWGNGSDRKNRLENAGYNYSEVQALVNEMVPSTPVKKNTSNSFSSKSTSSKSTSSKSTRSKSTSPARVQANNTIMINGYQFPISNVATQARLDLRRQELVNWGSGWVKHKTVGGGSIYLAVHVDSYGWMVQNANSITLKDINGNVKTYYKSEVYGPLYPYKTMPDYTFNYLAGGAGDAIAIQTCISGSNSTSYAYIFR